MNIMKPIALLSIAILASCGTESELYVDGPAKNKSIMVPAGLSPTAKSLKNVFRSAGWQTYVTGGSYETTGSGGNYVNVNTKAKYPARYSAWAEGRAFDLCLDFSKAISYDISILDNVTGQEVAAFSGSACERTIEKELKETLDPFL